MHVLSRVGNVNLSSFNFVIESSGACPQGMVDDWQNDRTTFMSYGEACTPREGAE